METGNHGATAITNAGIKSRWTNKRAVNAALVLIATRPAIVVLDIRTTKFFGEVVTTG